MSFRIALIAIAGVYLINLIATAFGVYSIWPYFDIPMHFLGGLTVGFLGIALDKGLKEKNGLRIKQDARLHQFIFVLGFVMTVAVVWEFHEYINDHTIGIWNGWASAQQPSLDDTMKDLLMGALGGSLSVLLMQYKKVAQSKK